MPKIRVNEEKTGTDEDKLDHSDRQRQLLYGKNTVGLNLYCFLPAQHHGFSAKLKENLMMTVSAECLPARRRATFSRWRLYLQRYHTRQSLLLLDDVQLVDIGLTRSDARREGRKPFWRR